MEAWLNPTQPSVGTPQRPSQARRAQLARSPAIPVKRQRTPSPPPASPSTDGSAITPSKQRRIEGGATRTRPITPALTASQRAARQAEIERGLTEAKKTARLASIEEALSAVQGSSQASVPSGSPLSGSRALPPTSRGGSSRVHTSEGTLHHPRQQVSDVPRSLFPSSASHNSAILRGPSGPAQSSQSDAGYSITSELEEAEFDDLEDKAIQTDPIDDEETIIDEFWIAPPSQNIIGSLVAYPSSPSRLADFGPGTSHEDMSREPEAESGHESWLPAPRHSPGRGRTPRVFTPGGNEGGMLLTPPGTSQRHYESASQRGRQPRQESPSPSPSPTKGKGRASDSASTSRSQWQIIQDDPVRVQYSSFESMWRSDAALLFLLCYSACRLVPASVPYGHPRPCRRTLSTSVRPPFEQDLRRRLFSRELTACMGVRGRSRARFPLTVLRHKLLPWPTYRNTYASWNESSGQQ